MAKIVDPRNREPKDPQRKQRAELVRAATFEDWQARPGAKLEKAGRGGLKLAVSQAPDLILDADGEIVGVDAWVQLFDERGRELPIDPHRRIINPPTAPRAGVRLVDTGRVEQGQPVMERRVTADPTAAFWEAVWDSIEEAPNPKGWRTRGTVTTVYADTADGMIQSYSPTYSTARAGGTLTVNPFGTSTLAFGQSHSTGGAGYFCFECYLSFDTSSIADSDIVSAAVLDLWLTTDSSTTDFTGEARQLDWSAGGVTSADWVAGASLGGLTLMASLASSGIGVTGTYKTFTSEAALQTATGMKTGTVYLHVSSSRQRNNNQPSSDTNEYLLFSPADAAGTTQDPKLTITHAGLGSTPFFTSRPNRIWRLG